MVLLKGYSPGHLAVFKDCRNHATSEELSMLFTIAVILIVLWLLGLVSGYTLGNFIYILLVIAIVLVVVGIVSGRRI